MPAMASLAALLLASAACRGRAEASGDVAVAQAAAAETAAGTAAGGAAAKPVAPVEVAQVLAIPASWQELPDASHAVEEVLAKAKLRGAEVAAWGDPARGCYAIQVKAREEGARLAQVEAGLRKGFGAPAAAADAVAADAAAGGAKSGDGGGGAGEKAAGSAAGSSAASAPSAASATGAPSAANAPSAPNAGSSAGSSASSAANAGSAELQLALAPPLTGTVRARLRDDGAVTRLNAAVCFYHARYPEQCRAHCERALASLEAP